MTLQEKFDEIREEAREEAREALEKAQEEAREDKINVILSFIKNGNLSLEDAAEGAGIPVEELRQRLQDNA